MYEGLDILVLAHSSGIAGAWLYVDPSWGTGRLVEVEKAIYQWRLEYLRQIIRDRLDEDAA